MSQHGRASESPNASRRAMLRGSLAASAAALLAPSTLASALASLRPPREPGRPWLDAALKADRWLATCAARTSDGVVWPADPRDPKTVQSNLYSGTPGVVLFYLELHHATGERRALDTAMAGADHLLALLPDEPDRTPMGLYTGLAGIATVLELTYAASHDARYRAGASRALSLVRRAAQPAGEGVEWNPSTDIISGSAGIGLFLLWARDRIGDERVVELAARAGTRLVERARPSHGGLSWLIQPDMGRNYPNFSHGAAGVSYFLASLYAVTRRAEFLDAARAGATYLDAISTTTPNGGRMVYHSTPGNEQLFYLSWCHGPAGTARLYHRLAAITGDAAWRGRVPALATAIRDMGVPGRSPGFWENVSQCCGNAGVVEFFLDLHRTSADPAHLSMAERVAGDALRRATADGDGLKWVQAEHRVQPALRIAQTGLMQGAAGVGLALLHLDGATQARAPFVVLPDNPFAVESRRGA